ncbi:alcohol O-acetyltransferase [Ascochyta rabiei]|uniref:Alcohol O-acetyltransferase n=1 Tax=Didymella rabiei TaxID=5454 RepID=A0A163AM19_DIDRA|nr:alcohol O-acetyltransferase [Ascochyta rabiei]
MTISWPFFLRAVAGSVLPFYFAQRSPHLWTGGLVPVEATPTKSEHRRLVIPISTTEAFAARCWSKSTSVTAALGALIAAGIPAYVQIENRSERKEIKIDMPASLRPSLKCPAGRMANAITNVSFTHTTPLVIQLEGESSAHLETLWEQAREIKDSLTKEVKKKGADNPIALLKSVSDMPAFFLSQIAKPRPASAEMSNLGVWRKRLGADDGWQGKWRIGRMTFS